ncbi:PREDICTED: histone H2B.v2-like [Ipomoea nil]|uniref:histone H2B.v2-like n=1 Tax=Ipomoea nil TaxID=35883 RepID=UPI000901C45D|nr:PREDICTED: histone H2B.v2-like [Ipomoea nil]
MKVTAIQEHKDLNTYRLSDLIGNLQTYELEMLQGQKNNGKGIALQSRQEENSETDSETMDQSIALLTKNFNRVLKKFNKSRNKNFSNNPVNSTNQKPSNPKRRDNTITEGIQCYECKGFGHIQSEYSEEDDNNTNFVAFTASHEDNNSDDMQELLEAYSQLNAKWEQIIKKNLELMEDNHYLKNEKERIEKQYKEAQNELLDLKNRETKLLQEVKELTKRPGTPSTDTSENNQPEIQEVSQQHFRH